ncbi:MAG: tyrosine--tRNA ligase [SAR86 cluster bacterium]|uniref:Tyrosine--tRNA ligase n=1 Tax=SAR86 cluster bacterium TaxID=2030880 RepID=A0A2A5CH61_9GAMM|nr:MAG: tyrosine--tRNA ligase [SAR86 cluster bacterium]
MTNINLNIVEELRNRGLLAQTAGEDGLENHLLSGSRIVYCGFDPTADSLHIGSLVPLLALKRFQLAGHKPIAVAGGATGMVGDPSFKSNERKLNSAEVTQAWTDSIKQQLEKFIDFDCGDNSALVVNNLDWTQNLDLISFLRDIGKHFSVNAMMQKESVKQRIEREGEGISFTEFAYSILQSYDFAKLNEMYDCTVQLGGNDQWGNITAGIDLTRRLNKNQVYGLTLPLITKADGGKFGKTEEGTIWIDSARTSCYAFYQFWINTADADVYNFLKYFTFLDVAEIDAIEEKDKNAQGRPEAQSILAREVTHLVHGEAGLEAAERISEALFSGDIFELTESDFEQLKQDGMPTSASSSASLPLVQALVDSELASSNKMAREFIGNGAVSVNGAKASDNAAELDWNTALFGQYFLLKRGKKLFHLLYKA